MDMDINWLLVSGCWLLVAICRLLVTGFISFRVSDVQGSKLGFRVKGSNTEYRILNTEYRIPF